MEKSTVSATGLSFRRLFSKADVSPYDEVEWELRTALISDAQGQVIFEQKDVEVPKDWSATATNIVASKYLHGPMNTPERETGVRQLIQRVAETIQSSGVRQGYFASNKDAQIFHDELAYILLNQLASFNSPVWFNAGCDRVEPESKSTNWHWDFERNKVVFAPVGYTRPQCSACFINSVDDSMEGIMELARTEAMLFKYGSGTGTNFSSLRGSKEALSGGGTASGPLSFMKGLDAFAGVIRSGGKTRRSAKMAILDADHPDVLDFIDCKMVEEAKAHALIREGYDGTAPDSPAYSSIFFQNANNSVRATDEFMQAAVNEQAWQLKAVRDRHVTTEVQAHELLKAIANATWHCGDPGMQFDTTINDWHTSKNTARINASNPCSEYMFLDDSACNLASLNLMKFLRRNNTFDVERYRHAVDVMITAMDIIVDLAGYPTQKIARNSHDYRPLGLGYANLGAMLMALGLPYNSAAGRAYAGAVTSLMCGEAYTQSARLAQSLNPLECSTDLLKKYNPTTGCCPGFSHNRDPFLAVINKHLTAATALPVMPKEVPTELRMAAEEVWQVALDLGQNYGYRNSQVTVLAPTGTIGFMMDCDTTGVEPELALVKYKKLVGGGMIKLVNETVARALSRLGYKGELAEKILDHIEKTGTIEGSDLAASHLPVFDTSFKPAKGTRSIHYMGHILMMSAVQPFLSGAISKTINMPEESTTEDIIQAYIESWKLGLKAVAIYRDGSKKNQVLVTKKEDTQSPAPKEVEDMNAPPRAQRHKLPDERKAIIHKFSVANHEGYLSVGLYPNGMPGEIFITMAKEGSTISGLMDAFALSVSLALQHGVPLEVMVEKFAHSRFEPSGWSNTPGIGYAKSIMDYIFRWLHMKYMEPPVNEEASEISIEEILGSAPTEPTTVKEPVHVSDAMKEYVDFGDAPSCTYCGSIMARNGSCYRCMTCGSTSGCS